MRRGKLAPLRLGCGFGLDDTVDLGEGKAGRFGKPPARLVFGREGWWLAEQNAEDVRPPLDLAGARAVAGALERYCGPLEARQCSRYRGARGRDELASFAVGEQ